MVRVPCDHKLPFPDKSGYEVSDVPRLKTSREMKKKYDYFIYYFPLFAFLFIGMGSILLSVSLSSCSSSVKNPLLLCADSLMEVSPNSALSILESISSPQKLSRTP